MRLAAAIALITLYAAGGLAERARAGEAELISRGLTELGRISGTLQRDPTCFPGQEASDEGCSKISDRFCQDLWDVYGGNMSLFDGKIELGRSEKSGIPLQKLADFRALIDAGPRLPADLREKAAPILQRMATSLARENKSVEWAREFSDIYRDFDRARADVATQRVRDRFPRGTAGAEEAYEARKIAAGLTDEITRAKYAAHPNWQRVERLFPRAKEDVLKTIASLPLGEARKKLMEDRVRAVRLELPATSPDGVAVSESCATTADQAYYKPKLSAVTVCAGLFNGFQSETALAQYLMHEISHSVDPENLLTQDFRSASPIFRQLVRLRGSKGAPVPCEEWARAETDILNSNPSPPRRTELEKLYSCLEPRAGMVVWNQRRVKDAAMQLASRDMKAIGKESGFDLLAFPPAVKPDGKVVPNEYFLRPDLFLKRSYRESGLDGDRDVHAAEIFTQVLSCQQARHGDKNVPYSSPELTAAERSQLLKNAMHVTERIAAHAWEDYFSYCGQNCRDLVESNSARSADETFADWLADRASWRALARIPVLQQRREASAASMAKFCEGSAVARANPDLTTVTKQADPDDHPDDRRRRLSIFNELNGGLLGCRYEPAEQKNFGSCEP